MGFMNKIEKGIDNKTEKKNEDVVSSDIENAHASGDGSLARDEETLIKKSEEDKKNAIKKEMEQYWLNFLHDWSVQYPSYCK